jgi:uncharacterized SAM-binding protein YcdF (DUF218 family)
MWGESPYLLGQLPKATLVAIKENASILVLGSGLCSGSKGEMESEFNRQYLLDNFYKLSEFAEFENVSLARIKKRIEQILLLDRFSQNTGQEVAYAGTVFEVAGIERVLSVTGPTHGPRCLNEALKFYSQPGSKIALHNVSVQVSDIGWASPEEVIVLEPPHRLDDTVGELRMKIAPLLLEQDKLAEIAKALGF